MWVDEWVEVLLNIFRVIYESIQINDSELNTNNQFLNHVHTDEWVESEPILK